MNHTSPSPLGDPLWLERRTYTDLPETAERALREAGLAFTQDSVAERHLARARQIAGDHEAVLVAEYRYYLYKHRYAEAARAAERCLTAAARDLGVPEAYMYVSPEHADFAQLEPAVRRWMYTLQAYAYVLLRAGDEQAAQLAFEHLRRIDVNNQTKTAELLAVVKRGGVEEE